MCASVSGAYTFTHGAYNGSSPAWNSAMLQTDYALSKRTDFYLEGVYQNAHGAPADSVLSHATPRPAGFNSWRPSAFSSSRTCALIVCTAMSSRPAARAKAPSFTTIQK